MIREHAGHHRFADGDGADADAWVVAAFGEDVSIMQVFVDRLARGEYR